MLLSLVQLFQPFGVWNSRFTFQIGNEATLDRPWAGEVHVVALYSRALSADEITDNFLEGSTAKTRFPEGLVSLYTFSEGKDQWCMTDQELNRSWTCHRARRSRPLASLPQWH